MDDVSGNLDSVFSPTYLNLQNTFCCDTGSVKLIRWLGCKPGVYYGKKTLFTSDDLGLCPWYQVVTNYAYTTIDFDPGGYAEIQFNGILYLFAKTVWQDKALDSLKMMEIGLNQQAGVVGSTIPFNIEQPSPPIYNYQLVRDLYHINTSSSLNGITRMNNCSPYTVSLSMLYAY